MTYRIEEGHPLDVLFRACGKYPGGVEALAVRLKLNEKTLYKKLRHQIDTHHMNYDGELSELLFCLAEAKVDGWSDTIRAFCWRHDHIAIPMPDLSAADDDELSGLVLQVVKEYGDVASALSQATSGSSEAQRLITSREFADFDVQVNEAMAALAALRERARASHEAAKAKGLVR